MLERIATTTPDCVIALPPSGLRDAFLRVLRRVPGVTVAVHDTPENILERITFYDIDSRRIDKRLTAEERILYMKEIKALTLRSGQHDIRRLHRRAHCLSIPAQLWRIGILLLPRR